jgi:PAS domain S-box-containing protein
MTKIIKPKTKYLPESFPRHRIAMDIIENILKSANKPGDAGKYLTSQLRKLTGAQVVIILQYDSDSNYKLLNINPPGKKEFVFSSKIKSLAEFVRFNSRISLWDTRKSFGEAEVILSSMEIDLSMGVPLISGDKFTGAVLLLDMPAEMHAGDIIKLLELLSPVMALILRNALLFENQEKIIKFPVIEDNKPNYLAGLAIDITDRKKAEEEIQLIAYAVESVSECISITDVNDTIIFVNKSFINTYGFNEEELLGKPISIIHSNNMLIDLNRNVMPKARIGTWRGEVLNRKKDGTIFSVMLSTSVIRDNNNYPVYLVGVATDITEAKKWREELIRAKEHAEKADKLKSEFLAQISHEIRSPLNVTLSLAQMIKDDLEGNISPDLQQCFDGMAIAGKRLIRTIDLILNMSELQVGSYEPTMQSLNLFEDIFKEIENEFSGVAHRKGLEFSTTNKCQSPVITGDRYSIHQIFVNLVDNAIKYTRQGFINILIDHNYNNEIQVTVKDSGIGISDEFQNNIFQPFLQEEMGYTRKYDGNGLGLALVKSYCDLNNAVISVESRKSEGSKFTVTFKNE